MAKYKPVKFKLLKVLNKYKVSQYELAARMNIDPQNVNRWVKEDYNPTVKTLNRIAKALDCPVSELLGP